MQYGYFDDENREYVITRPDTPEPWANYLGSPEYGAIISNNAGGYSFEESGANGRILRYHFNSDDQPGRYLYLRDNDSADYWSASWQPVGKDFDSYHCECRHGTAYTKMMASYAGIRSEVCYYVPMGARHEVWYLKLKNESDSVRHLTVSGYAEFTNNGNYEQDQVNLQYSQFISRTQFRQNRIRQLIHGNVEGTDSCEERFFGLAGKPVSSFCGSKKAFLGPYRTYGNPIGIERGDLGGAMNYCDNSCGALSFLAELQPQEEITAAFLLGAKPDREAARVISAYEDLSICEKEISDLICYWHGKLSAFKVKTPSPEFDSMVNTWNAFNCFITFTWSRAASFIYCGLRNGYGYRDTVQDIQGIIHLDPEMACEKLRFMLSAQVDNGGGLPLVKFTHRAGQEDTPDDESYVRETGHPAYRADDALWLFPTVYKYIAESGNIGFLDEVIPFANKDEGTVYEHLKRAIGFSLNHLGPHGLPAGLHADWNDCLRLGANGESSFVALQLYNAMKIMETFAAVRKDDYQAELAAEAEKLKEKINACFYAEGRFARGFTEDGELIGDPKSPNYNLWLNPQSWSVISGLADPEQAESALNLVHERLNCDYGAILMDPPFTDQAFDGALAVIYNAGVKENSAVFSQTQGWLILAEALLGHGDRAMEYYKENSPAAQNDRAEIRGIEPYSYGQFTEGKHSPNCGRSHVHWLTGTASTMMVAATEGILGLRPVIGGLKLCPALPGNWTGYEAEKAFRGKKLQINVRKTGSPSLRVNGKLLEGNIIPESEMTAETAIEMEI